MTVSKRRGHQGYIAVFFPDHPHSWPNGYIYAHRVVAEAQLGRLLRSDEEVHHRNKNTHDNDPSNLEVETSTSHREKHRKPLRKAHLVCAGCGTPFDRAWNQRPEVKGQKEAFCSRSCNGRTQRERQLT